MTTDRMAIVGGGHLGVALARGWIAAGVIRPDELTVTRRTAGGLDSLARQGVAVGTDNAAAVRGAGAVALCVRPEQLDDALESLRDELDPKRHVLMSTVSGVSIAYIASRVGDELPVVRAMPNIAVACGESMTCLAASPAAAGAALALAEKLFGALGLTMRVREEEITPATALCACGVAFFLRAIRAAAQGGVQVGFHAEDAVRLAAQTARGAASLLLDGDVRHPETVIDSVTTPLGVTIAGLNEMEHHGFSSAMIRGIVVAAQKASALLPDAAPTAR